MIPPFTPEGFLPAGLHTASWSEFVARFAHNSRRQRLLFEGLQHILNLLAIAGCTEVRIGGSFVTTKELPGDFDGIWMLDGVNEKKLPLEIFASVGAQPDIFGGTIVPSNWGYTDIGSMLPALEINRARQRVGVVVLAPHEVPFAEPLPRYRHFFTQE